MLLLFISQQFYFHFILEKIWTWYDNDIPEIMAIFKSGILIFLFVILGLPGTAGWTAGL